MKEPKFERRHYLALAQVMRVVAQQWGREAHCWSVVKQDLGDMLAADNPRFNRGKFEEACEP